MNNSWSNNIKLFIQLCNNFNVKMIMVGGGAVNFHGYQRHSADIDFWIDCNQTNFEALIKVFNEMGYNIENFPSKVINQEQNISIKFSPEEIDIELITNFSINKSFEKALKESETITINENEVIKWKVLNLDDLIISKLKSGRPKDLLDIQELKRINKR